MSADMAKSLAEERLLALMGRVARTVTVKADCKRCAGTGFMTWEELAPGEMQRYGGPPQAMVRRRALCDCVALAREEPKP